MKTQTTLRILVVDDHAAMREGLCLLIESQPDMLVAGQAADGRAGMELVKDCRPDVVVMDISMPNMDGVKATERLKNQCPNMKILVLTRHEDTTYIRRLIEVGADGYALKRATSKELLSAVRIVAKGGKYLDPTVAAKVVETFVSRSGHKHLQTMRTLTNRETEVLKMIARGDSNKEVAYRLSISVKTVEAHKANSMEKLGLHSRAGIIRYALINGWLEG